MSNVTDSDFLFLTEETNAPAKTTEEAHALGSWSILIADDDKEVHTITRMALKDVRVQGRSLNFYHAYSGQQAIEILEKDRSIAVILLDVVMESDDAGLRVVRQIREQLKNEEIRILLRTGQPGCAPEETIIRDFDINDYKTKTELTRSKLLTSIIAAIRSFQQIRAINQHRIGLHKVIYSGADLLELHSLQQFSEGVVTQIAALIGLEAEGVLCAQIDEDGQTGSEVYIIGAAGQYAPYIKSPLAQLGHARIEQQIKSCLLKGCHLFTHEDTVLYLAHRQHDAAVYLKTNVMISDADKRLIELFLTNISIGYENATLFHQLHQAAFIDTLTRTANRNEFVRMLEEQRRKSAVSQVTVLIDLQQFSDVNDGLGQDVGNELLIAVAQRLLHTFGENSQLARIGADVFGLIGCASRFTPDSLNELFSGPFIVSEHVLFIRACFGICYLSDSVPQGLGILKHAYIALNSAKRHLSQNYAYYSPDMEQQMAARHAMLRQLRLDFSNQKLRVWYQPQVCLQSGKVIGLEALCRWPTDDGHFISPSVFIPLAENSGLIVNIGFWVIEQACQQIQALSSLQIQPIRIAVNVSMEQWRHPHFATQVMDTIRRFSIDPALVELEITESVLMDEPHKVIAVINILKEFGIQIAIDDFGIGFSSLSYLQQLPLDRIKIDRAFLRDLTSTGEALIAQTIVELGKKMDLATIAEGIESKQQAEALMKMGCDVGQGFLFAKPMPPEELHVFLRR